MIVNNALRNNKDFLITWIPPYPTSFQGNYTIRKSDLKSLSDKTDLANNLPFIIKDMHSFIHECVLGDDVTTPLQILSNLPLYTVYGVSCYNAILKMFEDEEVEKAIINMTVQITDGYTVLGRAHSLSLGVSFFDSDERIVEKASITFADLTNLLLSFSNVGSLPHTVHKVDENTSVTRMIFDLRSNHVVMSMAYHDLEEYFNNTNDIEDTIKELRDLKFDKEGELEENNVKINYKDVDTAHVADVIKKALNAAITKSLETEGKERSYIVFDQYLINKGNNVIEEDLALHVCTGKFNDSTASIFDPEFELEEAAIEEYIDLTSEVHEMKSDLDILDSEELVLEKHPTFTKDDAAEVKEDLKNFLGRLVK